MCGERVHNQTDRQVEEANVNFIKRVLGWLVVIVILVGALALGIGLLGDDWTRPERDQQSNEEMEASRQICAGWALLLVIIAPPVAVWAYRAGRYGR